MVDVFYSIYAESVPPDGLEEVYRLHERARDGLPHLDRTERHGPATPRRPRRRPARARQATG